MIDVTVVILDGSLPSTSVAPVEIFASAGVLWGQFRGEPSPPRFRVRTVSLDGRPTRHDVPLSLRPDGALAGVRKTDLIVVSSAEVDLAAAARRNAALMPWLRRWHRRGATVAGVCSGVAMLAESGILDGKPATTHWALVDVCRQRYPRVDWQPDRFVTEAGRVVCGGGVYASIDLSLYLVEKYCGHELAVQTAKSLLLDTPRLWQASYAVSPPRSQHDDEGIARVQAWLFRNFRDAVTVDDLAARAGMSPRTFARRFKAATGESPLGYVHRLRIDAARHLLEGRGRSVGEVSRSVGYGDLDFFRRLFRRYTGIAPRAYRARFGHAEA